jgi:ribonuclease HI
MQFNISLDDYHLPTIAKLCRTLGSPAEGPLAQFVWHLVNTPIFPANILGDFCHSAGYEVGRDYPLTPLARWNSNTKPTVRETVIAWVDGGSRGNPGPSAYAFVLKGGISGETIYQGSRFIGVDTNNKAEYEGLLAALSYAVEHGIRRFAVRSDSELMVKQIRGLYRVRNEQLKTLHARAMQLIQRFEWFEIGHIPRDANQEADRLTNHALNTAPVCDLQ